MSQWFDSLSRPKVSHKALDQPVTTEGQEIEPVPEEAKLDQPGSCLGWETRKLLMDLVKAL